MERAQVLAQMIEVVREVLKSGRKVLIVGGRTTNFSDEQRQHPQFIFWDSTDPDTENKTSIPLDVAVVLLTEFIGHRLSIRIDQMLPSGTRFFRNAETTGQLRNVLDEALRHASEEQVAPYIMVAGWPKDAGIKGSLRRDPRLFFWCLGTDMPLIPDSIAIILALKHLKLESIQQFRKVGETERGAYVQSGLTTGETKEILMRLLCYPRSEIGQVRDFGPLMNKIADERMRPKSVPQHPRPVQVAPERLELLILDVMSSHPQTSLDQIVEVAFQHALELEMPVRRKDIRRVAETLQARVIKPRETESAPSDEPAPKSIHDMSRRELIDLVLALRRRISELEAQ